MLQRILSVGLGIIVGLSPMISWGGISSIPGFGAPSFSQEQVDAAYGQGRLVGRQESAAECIGEPANCGCIDGVSPCGIGLSSVLTGAQFGETEPNDHIVAADALVPEHSYWGQSMALTDQDWFYLVTNEPNQVLTLNFTVPERVLLDSTRLSQGWLIQVRDAAGNIHAQFDTRFAMDDPATSDRNESKEIAYPVFLGLVGTYYVVVQPRIADASGNLLTDINSASLDTASVLFSPYNIAAFLEYSLLDSPPLEVNFFDAETEPNDTSPTADPITSTTTMYGMLHANLVGNEQDGWGLQTEQDWFWYNSPGNETAVLAFCQHEDCDLGAGRDWRLTVLYQDGTVMTSFRTDNTNFVRFGLDAPGVYFLQIVSALKVDSEGRLVDKECIDWSEPATSTDEAQCLRYAQVAMVTTRQYNFTWFGTRLPPSNVAP